MTAAGHGAYTGMRKRLLPVGQENPSVFREEFYGFLYQYGNVIL